MRKSAFHMILAALAVSHASGSTILAKWTFESYVPDEVGPFFGAEEGVYANSSFASIDTGHTTSNPGGTLSYPAGNGSATSFGSNGWNFGDYFQFSVSTSGFMDVSIRLDQTTSENGPTAFELQYLINPNSAGADWQFVPVIGYEVTVDDWSSTGAPKPASAKLINLGHIGYIDNKGEVLFRLLNLSRGQEEWGGDVSPSAGTWVDNVVISGTALQAVPEPTNALVGILLACGLFRRQRSAGARLGVRNFHSSFDSPSGVMTR